MRTLQRQPETGTRQKLMRARGCCGNSPGVPARKHSSTKAEFSSQQAQALLDAVVSPGSQASGEAPGNAGAATPLPCPTAWLHIPLCQPTVPATSQCPLSDCLAGNTFERMKTTHLFTSLPSLPLAAHKLCRAPACPGCPCPGTAGRAGQ